MSPTLHRVGDVVIFGTRITRGELSVFIGVYTTGELTIVRIP
jgi:hypothetical protein